MYSLWAVGPFFEQLWGRIRFLVLYLIAGLGGSCVMVINNPLTLGAGASGALWGILAAHAVWTLLNRRYMPGALAAQMLRQVLIVLVINVGITFGVPNISAAAHFGGGIVGAIAALLLNFQRYGSPLQRRLALSGLIALPLLCLGAVAEAPQVDPSWQKLQLEEIVRPLRTIRVAPLPRQPVKGLSLQEVKGAVGDLSQACAQFSAGLERLRNVGPYQDATLEHLRKRFIAEIEMEIAECERKELRGFLLPLVADATRHAQQVYPDQGAKFDALDDNQRTRQAVDELLVPCVEARQQLEEAVALLRPTRPYNDPELEKQRRSALDQAESRLQGWKDTEQRWRAKAKS